MSFTSIDWRSRDWARDVAAYERHMKLLRTAESRFVKGWCERRIRELRQRWPSKLEYSPSEPLNARTQGVEVGHG